MQYIWMKRDLDDTTCIATEYKIVQQALFKRFYSSINGLEQWLLKRVLLPISKIGKQNTYLYVL